MRVPLLERPVASQPTLEELLRDVRRGRLRIPRFQRSFEWTQEDILLFFDSLYRGYPVGNMLLWETEQRIPSRDLLDLLPDSDLHSSRSLLLVIDGQQRLTSLSRVLIHSQGALDSEEDPERFRLYFDLEKREFQRISQGEVPGSFLPMSEALDTLRFLEWLERLPPSPGRRSLVQAANELVRSLRDYRIPIYTVRAYDEGQARLIFERLNACGKPLTAERIFPVLKTDPEDPSAQDLSAWVALSEKALMEGAAVWARTYYRLTQALRSLADPAAVPETLRKSLTTLRDRLQGATTELELEEREVHYRQTVVDRFGRLSFRGLSEGPAISLPLLDVYVEVQGTPESEASGSPGAAERRQISSISSGKSGREELEELDAMRHLAMRGLVPKGTESAKPDAPMGQEPPRRRPVQGALLRSGGLLILGDPGAGKTTLLQALALRAAQNGSLDSSREGSAADRDWQQQETPLLPIFVPLSAYDEYRRRSGRELSLVEFLPIYHDEWLGLPGLAPLFREALAQGRAVLLLDGLDEALDPAGRQQIVEQVNALLRDHRGRGNLFAVTTRVLGYREASRQVALPHIMLLDFGRAEIKAFVRRFCMALEIWAVSGRTAVALQRAAIAERAFLRDLQGHLGVTKLAGNPLMLTMLVLLRRQLGSLPERRIELYERYLRALLEQRDSVRSEGVQRLPRPSRKVATSLLIDLAFWLQEHRPSGTASRQDVLSILSQHMGELSPGGPGSETTAADFSGQVLRDLCDLGILVERGPERIGFTHLTFQEYYAARALARKEPEARWAYLAQRLHDPRYREVIRLCAGHLGIVEERRDEVQSLVQRIRDAGSPYEEELHRDLFLVADLLADEVGLGRPLLEDLGARLGRLDGSPLPSIQKPARRGLARLAAQGVVPGNLLLLREFPELVRHPQVKQLCLEQLTKENDPEQPAILALGLLAEEDPVVRDALLAKLQDGSVTARRVVIEAIGQMCQEDDRVFQALVGLREDPQVFGNALRVLVQHGIDRPEGRQIVLEILQGGDSRQVQIVIENGTKIFGSLRALVLDALRQLPRIDPAIRCVIRTLLTDPTGDIRAAAVAALTESLPEDAEARTAVEARLTDAEARVSVAAVEALLPWIHLISDVPEGVVDLLGSKEAARRIAAIKAVSPVLRGRTDLLKPLRALLEDPNLEVRLAAVSALQSQLYADPGLSLKVAAPLEDASWPVLHQMVAAVAPLAALDPEVRGDLLRIAIGTDASAGAAATLGLAPLAASDQEVRDTLLRALELPDRQEAAAKALAPLLLTNSVVAGQLFAVAWSATGHPWTRLYCLWELSKVVGEPRIRALMLQALQEGDELFRELAIHALGPLCETDPEVRAAIEECLEGPPDPTTGMPYDFMGSVRSAAIDVLGHLSRNDPRLQAKLLQLLEPYFVGGVKKEHVVTLYTAVGRALGLGLPKDPSLATKLEPFPAALAAALWVLGTQGNAEDQRSISPFLESKLHDENSMVRAAAVVALKPLVADDPASRAQVLQGLDDPDAQVQSEAVAALAGILAQDGQIRERVHNHLGSQNAGVRVAAIEALADLPHDAPWRGAVLSLLQKERWFHLWSQQESLGRWLQQEPALQHAMVPWLGMACEAQVSHSSKDYLAGQSWLLDLLLHDDRRRVGHSFRRSLAQALGQPLAEDPSLQGKVVALLDSPSYQARQGAAWVLAAMPGGPPIALRRRIHALLGDLRAEESWPSRLQLCRVLLNHPDAALAAKAIAVARTALDHGTAPHYLDGSATEVRALAAEVLGDLDPMHQDPSLVDRLLTLLRSDRDPGPRDAAYRALCRLLAAPALRA